MIGYGRNECGLTDEAVSELKRALAVSTQSDNSGSTHNFYHYPARFSPDIARAVLSLFSKPDDWILDPFMGGGTTIIEALSSGRRVVGVDLNSLALFVTQVRTTPLSPADEDAVRAWSRRCLNLVEAELMTASPIKNLPLAMTTFLDSALQLASSLRFPRQRAFARCAVLRLGQWALDGREFPFPRRRTLSERLLEIVEQNLIGLREFVVACKEASTRKADVSKRRVLLYRNAVGLEKDPLLQKLTKRPNLVFTSPPYASVHVLYHRWQYRGRKETPAPYWIANIPDGFYSSHYTGGSRTPTGRERYFQMIHTAFTSIRQIISPIGTVVQLIGFSDVETQLPIYLRTMRAAGFAEILPPSGIRLTRTVPNRKWYTRVKQSVPSSSEYLLLHRPN